MRSLFAVFVVSAFVSPAVWSAEPDETPSLEKQRMKVMRSRALAIRFRCADDKLPEQVEREALFRYDDIPRGYLDGAVWRWGREGRPLAIVTTELHPTYLGGGPRIVYDFLSVAPFAFRATSSDASWTPPNSAVKLQKLAEGPEPAATTAQRLLQMKRIIRRFEAAQNMT